MLKLEDLIRDLQEYQEISENAYKDAPEIKLPSGEIAIPIDFPGLVEDIKDANQTLQTSLTTVNVFKYPTNIHQWILDTQATTNNCQVTSDDDVAPASPVGTTPLRMLVTGNDPHILTYNQKKFNLTKVSVDETWEFSVYVKSTKNTTCQLYIFQCKEDGTLDTGSHQSSVKTCAVSAEWQQISHSVTITEPTAVSIQVRLDGPQSNGVGEYLWFDGMSLSTQKFDNIADANSYYYNSIDEQNAALEELNQQNLELAESLNDLNTSLTSVSDSLTQTQNDLTSVNIFDDSKDIYAWIENTGAQPHQCVIIKDTTTTSPVGSSPLKMTATGSDPHILTYGAPEFNLADISQNRTWDISFYAKSTKTSTCQLYVFEVPESGEYVAGEAIFSYQTFNLTNEWQKLSYSATMSSSTATQLQIRLDGPQNAAVDDVVWFDGLTISTKKFDTISDANSFYYKTIDEQKTALSDLETTLTESVNNVSTELSQNISNLDSSIASFNVFKYSNDLFAWLEETDKIQGNQAKAYPDTTPSPVGSKPIKVYIYTPGTDPHLVTFNDSQFNLAAIQKGQTWTAEVYVKSDAATTASIAIFEADATGKVLENQSSSIISAVTTEWTKISTTRVIQSSSAKFLQVRLECAKNGTIGGYVLFDGLVVKNTGFQKASDTISYFMDSFVETNTKIGTSLSLREVTGKPASDTAAGEPGQYYRETGFFYLCVASNKWIRFATESSW